MRLAVLFVLWSTCGFVAYGAALAYWQRTVTPQRARENYSADSRHALTLALGGPFGLIIVIATGLWRKGWTIK